MARKPIGHVKAVVRITAGEAERELYQKTYGRVVTSAQLSQYLKRLWANELDIMRTEIQREQEEKAARKDGGG